MNEFYLKKIDLSIDDSIKKKSNSLNTEALISYITSKINTNSSTEETTQLLENILTVKN